MRPYVPDILGITKLSRSSHHVLCCHTAGDLVVEYMGHLVRPRVADMLEARTYNQMVGAGEHGTQLNCGSIVARLWLDCGLIVA
jgi:hypothetical protein